MADAEQLVKHPRTDEEIRAYLRVLMTAFLAERDVTDEQVDWHRRNHDLERAFIAVDGGTQCGTTATFPSTLRLPGLAEVPVSCLTQVTVLPTHTRRGHLRRLMQAQLEAAVDAGEVASLLVAAEWPIYGRFGYGPITEWAAWEVDVRRAEVLGEPFGQCTMVEPAELDEAMAVVLAEQQATRPGCIVRPDGRRRRAAGTEDRPGDDEGKRRVRIVHRRPDGHTDGYVVYDGKERWHGMRPDGELDVADLAASSPVAERELWRYLVDVDLVGTVKWSGDPASVVRSVFADGRAARQVGRWDHIWARIVDVPAALSARSYTARDAIVVEVVDPVLGRGGRFALDAAPDGASCAPSSASPALTLPVAALSAAWVGGTDLRHVAAGGTIDEHEVDAVDRLATLLRWHQIPWCATDF